MKYSIPVNFVYFYIWQVYVDFHGHSKKKNVFMYGCSYLATSQKYIEKSESLTDTLSPDSPKNLVQQNLSDSELCREDARDQAVMVRVCTQGHRFGTG